MANPDILITPGQGTIGFSGTNTGTIQLRVAESGDVHFEGDQGSLLTITDDLSDSLFSVNDAAGMPVFEVFADDTIKAYHNNEAKLEIDPDNNRIRLRDDAYVSGNLYVSGAIVTSDGVSPDHISGLSGYFGKVGIGTTVMGGNTKLVVSGGYAGIGVTPTVPLHIKEGTYQYFRFTNTNSPITSSTSYTPALLIGRNDSVSNLELSYDSQGSEHAFIKRNYPNAKLMFYRQGQQHMMIGKDGKTLIGEGIGAEALFTVSGDASITGALRTNTSVGINGANPDSILQINNADSSSYRFGYGGTSDVYLDADDVYFRSDNGGANHITKKGGSLGIGTTGPTPGDMHSSMGDAKLHVYNSTSGVVARFQGGSDANGQHGAILINHSNDRGLLIRGGRGVGNTASGSLGLVGETAQPLGNAGGTIHLRAQSSSINGDVFVGIGTSNPVQLLEVDGHIKLGDGNHRNIYGPTNATLGIYANPNDSNEGIKFSTDGGSTIEMFLQDGGKVGIGTTNPETEFHIVGNRAGYNGTYNYAGVVARITNLAAGTPTGNTAGLEFGVSAGTNASARIDAIRQSDGSIDMRFFGGTTSSITGASPQMYIDGGNGNVGIGTTGPAAPLEIYSSNNETLRVTASDSQQASIGFAQGATNKWLVGVDLNANGSEDFFIYDANAASNRLIIDNVGKVGVGLSAPQAKLQVDGDASITGELKINNNVGIGTTLPESYSNYKALTISDSTGGQVYFKSTSSNVTAYAGADGNGAYFAAKTNHELRLRTNNADRLVITNAGTIGVKGQTVVEGSNSRADIILPDGTGIAIGSAYTFANIYGLGGDLHLRANSYPANLGEASSIYFSTSTRAGGQAGHVVVSGGHVGIGTEKPNAFDWNASSKVLEIFQNDSNGSILKLRSNSTNTVFAAGNAHLQFGNISSHPIKFYTAGSQKMVLQSAGQVGIGTTNPGTLLEVYSSAPSINIKDGGLYGTNATPHLQFSDGNTYISRVGKLTAGNSVGLDLDTISGHIRLNPAGNVGIGTASPSRPLEVIGTSNASVIRVGDGDSDGTASVSYIEFGANNTSWNRQAYIGPAAGGNSHLWIVNEENADILFYANNDEKMRITSDDKVGIGTAVPSARTHIYQSGDSQPAFLVEGSQGSLFSVEDTLTGSLMSVNDIAGLPVFEAFDDGTVVMGQYNSGDFIVTGNKVGIGETSPEGLLSFKADESNTPKIRFQNQHSVTTDAAISTYDDANGTTILIGSNLYIASDGATNRFNTSEQSAGFRADRGGLLQFYAGEDGATATERIRVTADGQVGIRTTDPDGSVLAVDGDVGVSGAIHSNNNVFANNYFANNYVYHDSDVDTYYGFLKNDHIVFRTAGTDRVLIDDAGHTSITGQLRTNSNCTFGGNISVPAGNIFYLDGGSNSYIYQDSSDSISLATNSVIRWTADNNEFSVNDDSVDMDFRVESNNKTHMLFVEGETDRVGIGTDDPVAALHIHGNSDNGDDDCQLVISDADTTVGSKIPSILFRSLNDAGGSYISTNRIRGTKGFGMQFATETSSEGTLSTVMTLDNSQNAGIGTTSPDGRLHTLSDGTGIIVANKTITGNAFEVFGTQGNLLTVTDDLSDSLFSVNDAAGMPVFEVFADDTIKSYRNNKSKLEVDPTNNRIRLRDNAFISGNLHISGSKNGGGMAMGEWPAAADYGFIGNVDLSHADANNYALLQHKDGETYLNSTSSLYLRLDNSSTWEMRCTSTISTVNFGNKNVDFQVNGYDAGGGATPVFTVDANDKFVNYQEKKIKIGGSGTAGRFLKCENTDGLAGWETIQWNHLPTIDSLSAI